MTALTERKTRLTFETADAVRYRGLRAVIIECESAYFCNVRLKGTRQRLPISYAAIYNIAAKVAADKQREERKAARAQKRGKR